MWLRALCPNDSTVMTVPELSSERLILRAHTPQDYGDLLRIWSAPEVVKYISGVPDTPETAWAKLMFHIGHWAAMGFGYWAVTARDGRYLGMVGFSVQPRLCEPALSEVLGEDVIEAGWVIDPKAQGQGIAQEAMQLALRWGDQKGFVSTVALIAVGNDASERLAAKLGYQHVGQVSYRDHPNQVWRRGGQAGVLH